jgi:hypothetical protein
VPAVKPDTTPDEDIAATLAVLLLHVPPAIALVSDVVPPIHSELLPVIVAGDAFTVIVVVAMQPVVAV